MNNSKLIMESDPFRYRVESYMYAVNTYPHCMEGEFKSIIEELELYNNQNHIQHSKSIILLNLDGVASPLYQWISDNTQIKVEYMVMESSRSFAEYAKVPFYTPNFIPIDSGSIDRICINASLHHTSREDRCNLYKEIYRILRPGGLFVLGDVMEGSKEDHWLNTIVDRYNPYGHKGVFFREDIDRVDLERSGFKVDSKVKKMRWLFRSEEEMVDFMKSLFCMELMESPSELLNEINYHLGISIDMERNDRGFEWELLYFIARKEDA
jgi:SAM-dependent methyltransferase